MAVKLHCCSHPLGFIGEATAPSLISTGRGIYFMFFFIFFSLLASWLFGFLASWLLGFSAFLASWLSGLFGFLLVYAAVGGFLALAFRILCIPSSSSAGGVLAFAAFRWFMRLLGASAFRILCFHSSSLGFLAFAPFHWFLDLASRIISVTVPPYVNHHLFEHHGGEAPATV